MKLAEIMRWIWRHDAELSCERDQNNVPYMCVTVKLRHPEGEVYRARFSCRNMASAPNRVVELIAKTRNRLNME